MNWGERKEIKKFKLIEIERFHDAELRIEMTDDYFYLTVETISKSEYRVGHSATVKLTDDQILEMVKFLFDCGKIK